MFLAKPNSPPITLALESVRLEKISLLSKVPLSGMSSDSFNTLSDYFHIVNPRKTFQNIRNRELYLVPFSEDRRLSFLPEATQNKMIRLIELRLFKPHEALIVAKHLTSTSIDYETQTTQNLIQLRLDELALLNIRKLLEEDKLQTNLRLKLNKYELENIQSYLESTSRLLNSSPLPSNFTQIEDYLNSLKAGTLISSLLRPYLERIYSPLL